MPRHARRAAVLLLVLAVAASPSIAGAQSFWMPRSTTRAVWIEALHPLFDVADEQITTGTVFVGYRGPLDSRTTIVAELCAARFGASGAADAFVVGNPYVGLEYPLPETPLFFEFGVRPSIVDTDEPLANATGLLSDVNRWEGFFDATSFQLGINARRTTASGLMWRARVAPVAMVFSGFGQEEWDGYLLYAVQAGLERPSFRAGVALCSRTLVFEEGSFGERTMTQADLHLDFGSGTLRPGIDVKLPLDEFDEVVPAVVGIRLGLALE